MKKVLDSHIVEGVTIQTSSKKYRDTEHIRFMTLPAVKAASCTIRGGYEQMPDEFVTEVCYPVK